MGIPVPLSPSSPSPPPAAAPSAPAAAPPPPAARANRRESPTAPRPSCRAWLAAVRGTRVIDVMPRSRNPSKCATAPASMAVLALQVRLTKSIEVGCATLAREMASLVRLLGDADLQVESVLSDDDLAR